MPPVLLCAAHPIVNGWIDRVIGWIDNKLEELARYAADPTAGGGLQSVDYFVLQLLNRHIPVLQHFRGIGLSASRAAVRRAAAPGRRTRDVRDPERRAREYPAYDHDDLENVFAPVMRDIQDFLSARLGRRAIRLEIIERAQNAFISTIRDRTLFRDATLVLEVAARRSLTEIQNQFPQLFKIGPNTKMNEIVHAHLARRAARSICRRRRRRSGRSPTTSISILDRKSPLWPEFSTSPSRSECISPATGRNSNLTCGPILEDRAMSDKEPPRAPFGRRRADDHPSQSWRTAAAAVSAIGRTGAAIAATPRAIRRRRQSRAAVFASTGRPCRAAGQSRPRRLDIHARRRPQRHRPCRLRRPTLRDRRTRRAQRQPDPASGGPAAAAARPPARRALLRASFASLMEQVADADQILRQGYPLRRHFRASRPTPPNTSFARPPTTSSRTFRPKIATSGRSTRMLSRFFGERIGGVRFFENSIALKLDPLGNYHVLELQHACLALGFQGVHRTSAGGLRDPAADPAQPLRDAAPGPPQGGDATCRRTGSGQALARSPAARSRSDVGRGSIVARTSVRRVFTLRCAPVRARGRCRRRLAMALHPDAVPSN